MSPIINHFLFFPPDKKGLRLHPRPPQDPRGGPALPKVARGGAADRQTLGVVDSAAVAAAVASQGGPLAVARPKFGCQTLKRACVLRRWVTLEQYTSEASLYRVFPPSVDPDTRGQKNPICSSKSVCIVITFCVWTIIPWGGHSYTRHP